MIPLIRPLMPTLDQIRPFYESAAANGVWSNFGPVYSHCIEEIRKWTGGYPVLCANATSAIGVLAEWSFDPERSVCVPDYTHAGSILPIVNCGIHTILMGCERWTRTMDPVALENALADEDNSIGGAVVVNPFGRGINRRRFVEIARRFQIEMIFDYAGAWGDFDIGDEFPTVYSFHATKSLPIGEGAVVVFPNSKQAEAWRKLTNFGTAPNRMITGIGGGNFKLSEASCSILAAQLESHEFILQRLRERKQIQRLYSQIEGVEEKLSTAEALNMNLSLCTIELPKGVQVRRFEEECERCGFIARQYYIPLHTMPAFAVMQYEGNICPELDRCVALPSDVTMEEARVIAEHVREIIERLLSITS